MIGWILKLVGPLVFKRGAISIFLLLLSSTGALAYVAKSQYDKKVAANTSIEWLQAEFNEKVRNEEINRKLENKQSLLIVELKNELNKKRQEVVVIPDDGCLDRDVPDDITDLLRD